MWLAEVNWWLKKVFDDRFAFFPMRNFLKNPQIQAFPYVCNVQWKLFG